MVRFKGARRVDKFALKLCFHPTMVGFKAALRVARRRGAGGLVSIPLWCDLKAERRERVAVTLTEFPSHYGAI